MRFQRTLLASAILAASGAAMAADGYEFSGHTARSQALQLDYFAGHQDSGDVWVNPALIAKYGNQVQLNADNRNNNGNGDGGVFISSGASTFGIYIGRDGNREFANNIDDLYQYAWGGGGLSADFDLADINPQSQFDLFYAFDTNAFAIGARLNYQANKQDRSYGPYADVSGFESVDAWLAHQKANYDAANANNSSAPDFPAQNATLFPEVNEFGGTYDVSEINLSIGFELKALGIDGALLFGKASGKFQFSESYFEERVELNDNNGVQEQWRNWSESEYNDEKYQLDKGTTFGLSLRGQVFENNNGKLTLAFTYLDQDYSTKVLANYRTEDLDYDGTADQMLEETYRSHQLYNDKLTDKREFFQLSGAYEKLLDERTSLFVFSGVNYSELKGGILGNLQVDENYYEDHVAEQFAYSYGTVGPYGNDVSVTEKFTRIPLVVAAEHSFNERWTGRASVSRDLYRDYKFSEREDEFNAVLLPDAMDPPQPTDPDQTTQSGPGRIVYTNSEKMKYSQTWANQPTTFMVGVGYKLGNFTLDTVLGKEFFTKGFDQSGVFGAASLKYNF